jgi:hypothetical protein
MVRGGLVADPKAMQQPAAPNEDERTDTRREEDDAA